MGWFSSLLLNIRAGQSIGPPINCVGNNNMGLVAGLPVSISTDLNCVALRRSHREIWLGARV